MIVSFEEPKTFSIEVRKCFVARASDNHLKAIFLLIPDFNVSQ